MNKADITAKLRNVKPEGLTGAERMVLYSRIEKEMHEETAPMPHTFHPHRFIVQYFSGVTAAIALVILMGTGATAVAMADSAGPGDLLYPIDIAAEKIQITFAKNVGFHTFVIDKLNVKHAIKQGEALTFTAPKEPGSFPFYCDIGSHQAQGMEGVLIVK